MARGVGQQVVREEQILPDTSSPGVSITAVFGFQSYFDTGLLENAILQQAPNQPIVDNEVAPTLQANIPGYTFGLHPSSQTPVAVQPLVGGQPASPQAVILRPGQIYRPHGRPWGKAGNFSGFRWGLPFGWLGGGMATLYVFPSPDADAAWPGNAEVIFHRQTMEIADPAALPANAPFNWPMRFPWPHAFRGSAPPIDQTGAPTVAISEPTRIIWSLQLDQLANPAEMRALIQASNDFDLDSAMQPILTPVRFVDYTWGTYAQFGAGNLGTAFPVFQAPPELVRIAADDGGVQLVDISAGGDLIGEFVDVVRYGKI